MHLAGATEIKTSLHARFSEYGICKRNDVVLLRGDDNHRYLAGQILLLACLEGVNIAMLETWSFMSSHSAWKISKWNTKEASKMLVPLEDLLDTVVHTAITAKDVVSVLHPAEFRWP